MTHPMKHYEDLKRAWRRLHAATGDICKAFDEGDMAAVDMTAKLVAEALEDITEAASKFSKATEGDSSR